MYRRTFLRLAPALGLGLHLPANLSSGLQRKADYPVTPVSHRDVQITDAFWKPRIDTTRTFTLPFLLQSAAKWPNPGDRHAERLLEAACGFLAERPDPALRALVDHWPGPLIEAILKLKEQRWPTQEYGCTLTAGKFLDMAVADYQATGQRRLLNTAIEIADDLDASFGPQRRHDIAIHPGVKIGLVNLYRETGDEKYLRLAKFFLDERGNWRQTGRISHGEYAQDHQPLKAQTAAVGHCVKLTYLCMAMTDIAVLTGDSEYARAAERLWEDVVSKRTFLTGGIGSYADEECFGEDYYLPNLYNWCETCASDGYVLWTHRMFLLTRDAKYLDVMERVVYNSFLADISLKGDTFLYQTPLKALPGFTRRPRFSANCCSNKISRFLALFGDFVYAYDDRGLYINLFVQSRTRIKLKQALVTLEQETRYPWEGAVRIGVKPERPARFAVFVRLPGWARGEVLPGGLYRFMDEIHADLTVRVNGKKAPYVLERGFVRIEREWAPSDSIDLELPMPVRKVLARDEVIENRGMVALQRGPLVYCVEALDNGGNAFNLVVPDKGDFRFAWRPDVLGGIGTLTGEAIALSRGPDRVSVVKNEQNLLAVPYYAWGNRETGEMAVWLARDDTRTQISRAPETIASTSRVTTSARSSETSVGSSLSAINFARVQASKDSNAINDLVEPVSSRDGSCRFLRLVPESTDTAWVQYDFARPEKISSAEVYWKCDKFCALPNAWRLLYKDGGVWRPVRATAPYGVEKDKYNKATFDPVTTTSLRMEIQLQGRHSRNRVWYTGGIIEWRVNPEDRKV